MWRTSLTFIKPAYQRAPCNSALIIHRHTWIHPSGRETQHPSPPLAYDPAEDLNSDGAIATFMAEAFGTNDAGYIAYALGIVDRAKGMAQIAGQTGLSREQLYRSFSANGNPTLKTTLAVMKALGIELTAKVVAESS